METELKGPYTPTYKANQRIAKFDKVKFIIFNLSNLHQSVLERSLASSISVTLHLSPFSDSFFLNGGWNPDLRDEHPNKFLDVLFSRSSTPFVGFVADARDVNRNKRVFKALFATYSENLRIIVITDHKKHGAKWKIADEFNRKGIECFSSVEEVQCLYDMCEHIEECLKVMIKSKFQFWTDLSEMYIRGYNYDREVIIGGLNVLGLDESEYSFKINTDGLLNEPDFDSAVRSSATISKIFYCLYDYDISQPAFSRLPCQPCFEGCHVAVRKSSYHNKWALLLPIMSTDNQYSIDGLRTFFCSLINTVAEDNYENISIYFGIDHDDDVLNSDSWQNTIQRLSQPFNIKIVTLREQKGHICKMWNVLAESAVSEGANFFVLLGDDIEFEEMKWIDNIEAEFEDIQKTLGLPYGFGCVCFHDSSFPGFPTFPVLHRQHMDYFKNVLPEFFVNQGGDPYLFDIYSRFGGARFAKGAKLRNGIGGNDAPRYNRCPIRYRGERLERAVRSIERQVGSDKRILNIAVIVPTYRMNIATISKITSLRASVPVFVSFLIIVDNPDSPKCHDLRKFQDLKDDVHHNYRTSVIVHPKNLGASAARNTGLMRNCAELIIFLDDDVEPERNLLDAYISAWYRNPKSALFGGVTELPKCITFWQWGLKFSGVTYFYGVSNHFQHPPWSVTANLALRSDPENVHVLFGREFPNTGGGEDVDFCLRIKECHGEKSFVSVKNAKVRHPWLGISAVDAFKHVLKWVVGDSTLCEQMTNKTFFVMPAWHEFLTIMTPCLLIIGRRGIGKAFCVIMVEFLIKAVTSYAQNRKDVSGVAQFFGIFYASLVLMAQEMVRFLMHLRRGQLQAVCRRFDWFDGQNEGFIWQSKLEHLFKFALYVFIIMV